MRIVYLAETQPAEARRWKGGEWETGRNGPH